MKKYLLGIGIGLVMGILGSICASDYIEEYKLEKNIKVMKNSTNAASITKSVQELMESREGINKVSDYLTEKHDNSIARLAAFDTIRHKLGSIVSINFTIAFCSFSLVTNDVDVRKQSLELLKENIDNSFLISLKALVSGLWAEKDESILTEKIKLLSKWLFMDENEIQQTLSDKGIEEVSDIFKRRIQELSDQEK